MSRAVSKNIPETGKIPACSRYSIWEGTGTDNDG
jgi:hypothetical protein